MEVKYIVNNYILGKRIVRLNDKQVIKSQKRLDKTHTEIICEVPNEYYKDLADKILTYKGEIL